MYKRTRKKLLCSKFFAIQIGFRSSNVCKLRQVETCEDFGSFDFLDFFTMQTTTETTEDDTTIELPDEVTEEIHNDIVEGKSANQRYL